jgi:hypothetical protein
MTKTKEQIVDDSDSAQSQDGRCDRRHRRRDCPLFRYRFGRTRSTKIWQVFLAGVLSIIWLVPALSQQIPKEIVGKWYRIQGTSESSLSIEVHRGKLFMENHLYGEGYVCDFPSSNIHAQQLIRSGAKFVSTSGNAACRAEENPVEKTRIFFVYFRRTNNTETLVFAEGSSEGPIELLQRNPGDKR